MSESNFDEQLDRVLRQRSQAEVPLSLEERIQTTLTRKRVRIAREMWWAATMAACLLMGALIWHRLLAPVLLPSQAAPRTPQSLVQATNDAAQSDMPLGTLPHRRFQGTSHVARRAKLDANVGARQSETTAPASAYSPRDVGIAFHMSPATLRIAEHTAACALTPCSCAEMCRTSN
jgi:hypothetical protein